MLTYCEVLELNGKTTPAYARERNLLNLMAYYEYDGTGASLANSLLVFDLSQSITRVTTISNGTIGGMATTSKLYVMRNGSCLAERDLVLLSGLPFSASFQDQTPAAVLNMLGNSMHLSGVGVALGIAVLLRMNLLTDLLTASVQP